MDEVDIGNAGQAPDCTLDYQETIKAHQDGAAAARRTIPCQAVIEIDQRAHGTPLSRLFD